MRIFWDRKTRVGIGFCCSPIRLRENREPEAENYPPSSIGHAKNRNETLDPISGTEYWQERKKACKQKVAGRMCG
jgi:hypothetical protein